MLFGPMTVRENLELGAYMQTIAQRCEQRLALVHGMFPILSERSGQPPRTCRAASSRCWRSGAR